MSFVGVFYMSFAFVLTKQTSTVFARSSTSLPGNDCGSAGRWEVPLAPKEHDGEKLDLVQVQAIIRHGDRTPWTGDYCWPGDSSLWNCYLTNGEIPMNSDGEYGKVVPRLYRKVFGIGREPLDGNCSVGQLTTIGFVQQLSNGKVMKKAYVDSGFLSEKLDKQEMFIRSDNVPRTLQSAQSLVLGMYPPQEDIDTEVLSVHTLDVEYDYMTANPVLCPKYGNYSADFLNSTVRKRHSNTTKSLLDDIKLATNFSVDESDLDHFADCLRTHYCHSLEWPKGMTDDLYDRTWTELAWQFYNSFKYPSISENAQVGIGFLLKELWQNMNLMVSGKTSQKFLLYSGHDTTLIPLLVSLQVDDGIWPSYASVILLELYSSTTLESQGSHKYYVRMIYNGKVLQLPFCGSKTDLCDFEFFSKYVETVVPIDATKLCGQSSKNKWKWYS